MVEAGRVEPSSPLARGRSADPWQDTEPIRGEIFGHERFERHAESLADSHILVGRSPRVVPLLARLDQDEQELVVAYRAIIIDIDAGRRITPAAEWIADNFYAVETHVRQVRQDLPPDYFRALPKLGPGSLGGHPRVLGVVWAYVAHTDSSFDPDLLADYVRAYEGRKALRLGELWAVAITLRMLLIENLRRVADQVVSSSEARKAADDVADQVLGFADGSTVPVEQFLSRRPGMELSRPFAVQLLRRLSGQGDPTAHEWLVDRLRAHGKDPELIVLDEQQAQANASITVRNIFTSLRRVSDTDWEDWVEEVSLVEEALRANPGYAALDFPTRNLYRSAIEELARGSRQREIEVARSALQRAASAAEAPATDVGFWLLDSGRPQFARALGHRATWRQRAVQAGRGLGIGGYLAGIVGVTAGLLALTLWWLAADGPELSPGALVALATLAALPVSDLALELVNYWTARFFDASILPGLALRDGVPEDLRTLVVIPALLTDKVVVGELVEQLEIHYLANSTGEIYFAAVTDAPDSPLERDDDEQALLQVARTGVHHLNEIHGDRFLLLHRSRRHNPAEGVWMGWERKRGKLDELNRLLRGAKDVDLAVVEGHLPGHVRYVITLDSDTRLPREAATRLVAKISHPLNQARLDRATGRVVRGYGILQPRVSPSLPLREASSRLQRVYSQPRGLDPYAFAVSDVYQDLFGEGSFAGKGIYDVDVVMSTLDGRVPENALLSHDLLEGSYARSGLVTDIEVVEEFPADYLVAAARMHRWIRGDWQLLPWILRRHDGLRPLDIWKMVDNLRRSLSPIALALGFVAVVALPTRAGAMWLAILLGTMFLPPLVPLGPTFVLRRKGVTKRSQLVAALEDLRNALVLAVLNLVLIGHHAWLTLDAVCRTLYRLTVSHRNLLEWTTAAQTAHGRQTHERSAHTYLRHMRGGLALPLVVLVVAGFHGPAQLALGAVPVLLWLAAPYFTQWFSTLADPHRSEVSEQERTELRLVARRTWHFFDTFVTAEENHLPPDNFQEDPQPVLAHRTSPTNIGLYLLSTVSAHDLGWVGLAEAVDRVEATLRTVESLQLYRGHVYNWIDTQTLAPLDPPYVSTVDSGNFAGHLLVVARTCRDWLLLTEQTRLGSVRADGVLDGVQLVRDAQTVGAGPAGARPGVDAAVATALDAVETAARSGADAGGAKTGQHAWQRIAAPCAHLLRVVTDEAGTGRPSGHLEVVFDYVQALTRTVESQRRDSELSTGDLQRLRARIRAVEVVATRLVVGMEFAFLCQPHTRLLSVGFHVPTASLDDSSYDLLASEARLASYLAIAKGDVPTRHWFRLGRAVTAVPGGAALQSWSGSMFEYLMPHLVMRTPLGSLLGRTADLVVRRQESYAATLHVPWGISEAAYNARDLDHTYQYSPFGVPGLGLVRGLSDNLVVAPYATGLASMVDPAAAVANFAALRSLGAYGRYGFYESLDFTPERLPDSVPYAVIRCFMSHHQGMTIAAIHNTLSDGLMRDRFHAVPMVRAAELLLQERAPRHVPVTPAVPERRRTTSSRAASRTVPHERAYDGVTALVPTIHHMANERLSLTLTPAGGGQLRWKDTAITRWHPDRTTEGTGDHIYLRGSGQDDVWSATPLPILGSTATIGVRFAEDRAVFSRTHGPIRTDLEYRISPGSDALVRRLTITNRQEQARIHTVTSYAELALGAVADDDAHPVFSRMFVHTEFLPEWSAIVAHRRRRSPGDPEVWAGHTLYVDAGRVGHTRFETDRRAFLGRGHTARDPDGPRLDRAATGSQGYVLDPVFSLSQRVRVPGHGQATAYLWTFAGGSRIEVLRAIEAARSVAAYERVAMLSWTQAQIQLRHLGVSPGEAALFQTLAGYVVFPHPALLVDAARGGQQSMLWPLSISGDLPIILVRIASIDDLVLVTQMVRAFEFWRVHRFAVDLVLLNDESTSYVQDLHQLLDAAARGTTPRTGPTDSRGQIFVVRADQVSPQTRQALVSAAAVVLDARRGDLAAQVPRTAAAPSAPQVAAAVATAAAERAAQRNPRADGEWPRPPVQPLRASSGFGGFSEDGREYVTVLEQGEPTPAPWSNVVANEQFGFIATAEGAGSVWWRNSRDNQITPWRNDPVTPAVSEAIYVRDELTGRVSTPTAAPLDQGRHMCWHGFGYTAYLLETPELRLDLIQFVPVEDAVKVGWLKITNLTKRARDISVTAYHELVLGTDPRQAAQRLVTEVDTQTGAVLIRNPWSLKFADQVVFVDLAGAQNSWTADRSEFLGTQGTTAGPAAVIAGTALSGRVGGGLDPCAALQQRLNVLPGQTVEVRVHLGAAHDVDGARELVRRYRDVRPLAVLEEVRDRWAGVLRRIQVQTPDPSFDTMMNGWLLYQTLGCRVMARSGFYQASGAYGFRDQLQDGMSLVLVDPARTRAHLLRAAGRQFVEGDVQHWWLPEDGSGVRTRISDDVVWLAHAVCRYVRVTGDAAVLEEPVPYLDGHVLAPEERESFFVPSIASETGTLYAHCVKALGRAFAFGPRGLPLIGTGDWNDGMNRVGVDGDGESVWLGWFLHATLTDFAVIADQRGDTAFAARCRAEQGRLLQALEDHGWDGAWYRRGYFDDGTPLGSVTRSECRIDAIAQSWAVISGAARPERARMAMAAVEQNLVMHPEGIVRLFTPPFVSSEPDPGYIRAYPPGVRENGGQYTHGATWSIFAYAALGQEDKAAALFSMLNPINHATTPEQTSNYRVEPYVIAADVYSEPPYVGRGGWTWYTGSSGWLYRAGLEAILGLRLEGDAMIIHPCLPPQWTTASVQWRFGGTNYVFRYEAEAGSPRRVASIELDGAAVAEAGSVPMMDDGQFHEVRIVLIVDHPAEASASFVAHAT